MNKIKKLIFTILTIFSFTFASFLISPSLTLAATGNDDAEDVEKFSGRLEIDSYENNGICKNVEKKEYDFMFEMLTKKKYNHVTFLEQPLSLKNNVFIAEECKPTTPRGTDYKCKSRITCECTPKFPNIAGATPEDQKSITCRRVQFITYKTGQELAAKYVNLIYRWISSIVGIIAVIYIIVNAIIISSAQNDSGQVTAAKDRIVQSLIALVVLLSLSLVLYAINPTFFTRDIEVDNRPAQSNQS
jgi:hypothetical protein